MLVVGLTGNYGMGKSAVLSFFRKCGALTLSADEIVSGLLRERRVLEELVKVLGGDAVGENGEIDRKRVAAAIFRDEGLRASVEKILHPLVFEQIEDFLSGPGARERCDRIVIVEIPLLFESEHGRDFDRTITVFTDEQVALGRLREAGVSAEDALLRLAAQMPIKEKIERSDFVIDNSGSPDETERQVRTVYEKLVRETKGADECR